MEKITDCKSFGKKVAGFKKCEDCQVEMKEACQEMFKASFIAEKKKDEKKEEKVVETQVVTEIKSDKEGEKIMENTSNNTQATAGKIGKAQEIKSMIFSLAKKAAYTRRELGAAMREAFPEYKNSTLSTYISDSFNVKYAGATGCGIHRMLAYVQVGKKKVIVVR